LRRLIILVVAAAATSVFVVGAAVAGSRTVSDGTAAAPTVDTGSAIVQLNGDGLATYAKTKPAPGKKIDFSSAQVKSYRAQLSAIRNDFKQWLQKNAPAANIVGQFDIGMNAVAVRLNGVSLATIESAPMVRTAAYESLYRPQATDPDLTMINAFAAWGSGGAANAGRGVKVGIVDTGIDQTHPCFTNAAAAAAGITGPPAGFPKGDTSFTDNKVIVARVFNNRQSTQHYTPEAIQEHGTHVSGTVSCDWGLTHSSTLVNGVSVPYGVQGVAPGAWLGNYNVFPGDVTDARSEDIFKALESAYEDGMDVVNMSLGGGAKGNQDLLIAEVDHLDNAGMVVAIAAGNAGPGHYTVQSPGAAQGALTAGAATVGHFIGSPVTVAGIATPIPAASGDFATVQSDLTRPLAVLQSSPGVLSLACSAISTDLTGKIAVLSRGTCTFSTKIRNAQAAHADAVIVVNNVNGDPTAMGQDGTPNQPTIPAYMVGIANRAALIGADTHSATIGATQTYFQTANSGFMAGFSSQGPTNVDFLVKPDVVAPGVNVLSSIPLNSATGTSPVCTNPAPATNGCWAFFQGTSMATPHLAGSAAVVIGRHGSWSAPEVRSAIVNTAAQDVLKRSVGSGLEADPNVIGSGLENLAAAVDAHLALDPVSASWGAVPSGSGQTKSVGVTVTNLTGSSITTALTVDRLGSKAPNGASQTASGVTFSAPFSVTVPANGSATVPVTMSADKSAPTGDHWATLEVGSLAHEVLYTFIK
jgi:minor extracellular serine protease Vpr